MEIEKTSTMFYNTFLLDITYKEKDPIELVISGIFCFRVYGTNKYLLSYPVPLIYILH